MEGSNFYSGFGSLHCVFGETVVEATFIELGSILECETPASGQIGFINFKVSIDGMQHAFGNSTIQYYFMPETISFSSVIPLAQDIWGRQSLTLTSSDSPSLSNLEKQQSTTVLCQYEFSTSGVVIDTIGQVTSDTEIICPL